MKFFNSLLIATALVSTSLSASFCVDNAHVDGGIGWRHDKFKVPVFKNFDSVAIDARAEVTLENDIFARVDGEYAWLIKEKKNFNIPFSFTNEEAILVTDVVEARAKASGFTYGVTGVAGYTLCFCDGAFKLTPLVGYTYQRFDLKFRTRFEASTLPELAILSPIRSKSNLEWNSFVVGLDVRYAIDCSWDVFAEAAYLPNCFQYHHSIKHGATAAAGVKYHVNENWDAGVRVKYMNLIEGDWQAVAAIAEVGYTF